MQIFSHISLPKNKRARTQRDLNHLSAVHHAKRDVPIYSVAGLIEDAASLFAQTQAVVDKVA